MWCPRILWRSGLTDAEYELIKEIMGKNLIGLNSVCLG